MDKSASRSGRPVVKRILVPTDFSPPSDRALETAIAYAIEFGAAIDLLHVHPPIAELGLDVPHPGFEAVFDEKVERPLAQRAARVREAGLACEVTHLGGVPQVEIVEYARAQNADLIVMGTHGRTGLRHAILGSVAERVVQRSPCPVLVVPPERA